MTGIVYFHVPKCGGTSFGSALRLRYFYSQAAISLRKSRDLHAALFPGVKGLDRIKQEYELRDDMLADLMARGYRCITAHARIQPDRNTSPGKRYRFVTLLRDPVQRFVSHYRYLQHRHPHPARAQTLDAFLETQDAERIANQYLFYFARTLPFETDDIGAGISRARCALEDFALIGDLGRPSKFNAALGRLCGLPLPVLNRNRARNGAFLPSGETLRRIKDLCAPDIAIYEHANSLKHCV